MLFQLEKEIAAKEESRRDKNDLSGNINGMAPVPTRRTNLQEVDLHAELDTLDEPVWDTVVSWSHSPREVSVNHWMFFFKFQF